MTGGPTCWKPRGTFCKILIGYLPFESTRCLQYSQDEIVKMMITKAFLNTERKKNVCSVGYMSAHVCFPCPLRSVAHFCSDSAWPTRRRLCVWRTS